MTLRDDLRKVDLFHALPDATLDQLIGGGVTLKKRPGSVLVEQGSADAGFQLIRRGSVSVTVSGVDRGEMGPGDFFGEMSLLESAPRSATVVAGPEGAETFAVSSAAFSSLMDNNPQVARLLIPVLIRRIRAIESRTSPAGE
jgi:CRP/FNR family cyclic AMP-dependent transcriptional regulator